MWICFFYLTREFDAINHFIDSNEIEPLAEMFQPKILLELVFVHCSDCNRAGSCTQTSTSGSPAKPFMNAPSHHHRDFARQLNDLFVPNSSLHQLIITAD